ncbi:MAG TPA: methyltransferase domain-containing protein [Actinomycetota bacterium]|nr:methyltransferase domain-containing protein [Actinomycetota bacterium]
MRSATHVDTPAATPSLEELERNDPRQYDHFMDEWWRSGGRFAALQWIAAARAALIPPPPRDDAVLVDLGCGGGLLAPFARGYRHVGVDLMPSALNVARRNGVRAAVGDVRAVPVASGVADVVVAGEILEHVRPLKRVVAEIARILRPGGRVVIDTIADGALARLMVVTIAERLPGGPPPKIHDPDLFVSPDALRAAFAGHGIDLKVRGLRPSAVDYLRFLMDRQRAVRMLPTRSIQAVYQAVGTKRDG